MMKPLSLNTITTLLLLSLFFSCNKTTEKTKNTRSQHDTAFSRVAMKTSPVYSEKEEYKADIVATLNKGTKCTLIEEAPCTLNGNIVTLALVELSDGKTRGYTRSENLALKAIVITEPSTTAYYMDNERSGIDALLPLGAVVFVTEERGNWVKATDCALADRYTSDSFWIKDGYTDDEALLKEAITVERALLIQRGELKEDSESLQKDLETIASGKGRLNGLAYSVLNGTTVPFDRYPEYINMVNCEGFTPLAAAAEADNFGEVVRLVEAGADTNLQSFPGFVPLTPAALHGNMEMAKYLVEHGADINVKNTPAYTPLVAAAIEYHMDMVTYLVEHGADVNCQPDFSPLMAAATNGNMEMVQYLVEHGADVNLQNKESYPEPEDSPDRRPQMIIYFEDQDNVSFHDYPGYTALVGAAMTENLDVVKYLVEHGAKVNLQTTEGDTALMWAAVKKYPAMAKYLLNHGADVNLTNQSGYTALSMVSDVSHLCYSREMMALLQEGGATNLESYSEDGTEIQTVKIEGDAVLIGNLVHFRSRPSIKSESQGLMLKETHLILISRTDKKETIGGKKDYWYKCWLGENYQGWVFGSLIQKMSKSELETYYSRDDNPPFDHLNFYPDGFDRIVNREWGSASPQVRKQYGDSSVGMIIKNDTLWDPYDIDESLYRITEIQKENQNRFILSLKLIGYSAPLTDKENLNEKYTITYHPKAKTVDVVDRRGQSQTFYDQQEE